MSNNMDSFSDLPTLCEERHAPSKAFQAKRVRLHRHGPWGLAIQQRERKYEQHQLPNAC